MSDRDLWLALLFFALGAIVGLLLGAVLEVTNG